VRVGARGGPDIVCVINGRYVGLEVKTPSGKMNDNQAEFSRNLMKAGGLYFVVRSLDDAVRAIDTAVNDRTAPPSA
jgi:hypothetical protein